MVKTDKKTPKWVLEKGKSYLPDTIIFVGATETKIIKDGKLPNGDPYLWKKRRV
jgi:hypothetical protein